MSPELARRFGRFVLLEQLGSGGVGEVYVARLVEPQAGWPESLVVKILKEELAGSAEQVLRFRHEAELGARIASEYWPRVLEAGSQPELFIAMERISGAPLTSRGRALGVGGATRVLVDYLAGLQALHSIVDPETRRPLGLVHRDLSPKNLLVDELGRGRLIDLGLSRSAVQDWRTRAGGPAAETKYAAPEVRDGGVVDHRADLYSLAVVMREVIAGLEVPAALVAVLDKASAERANDRWLSAEEMREAVLAVERELVRSERPAIMESELPTEVAAAKVLSAAPPAIASSAGPRAVAAAVASSATPPAVVAAIDLSAAPPVGTAAIALSAAPPAGAADMAVRVPSGAVVIREARPMRAARWAGAAIVVAAFVSAIAGTVVSLRASEQERAPAVPAPAPVPAAARVEPRAVSEDVEPVVPGAGMPSASPASLESTESPESPESPESHESPESPESPELRRSAEPPDRRVQAQRPRKAAVKQVARASVATDPLADGMAALEGTSAAVAFAEMTNELVMRADKLADAKEREAIKSLATASGVARDIAGMKRAIARLKSAEEREGR